MPFPVFLHQERKILDVVIHITTHYIEYHPAVEFRLLTGRNIQPPAHFEQIFITCCIGIHRSKRLSVYFLPVYPVIAFRQKVIFPLYLNKPRGHHGHSGFLCHLIVRHFHLCKRKIFSFRKFQDVISIAFGQGHLARTYIMCGFMNGDNGFRVLSPGRSSYLIDTLQMQRLVFLHRHLFPFFKNTA